MAVVSTVVGFVAMIETTETPWYLCLFSVVVTSLFGVYTEMDSRDGNDTVTVPVVNVVILLILQFILYR